MYAFAGILQQDLNEVGLQETMTAGLGHLLLLGGNFEASTGAKRTNLVVVSLLSILTLPSDIAILNLYIS